MPHVQIKSDTDHARDLLSGLVLSRPDKRFIPSYIEALKEGLNPARSATRDEEVFDLLKDDPQLWKAFTDTCVNGTEANRCLEDLFWLTRMDRFMGFVCLRSDLGPLRQQYGGNTGRELRPSERNKGYGTIAVELTKAVAKNRDYSSLEMVTAFDNIAAIRSWEKCGGRFIERYENPPNDYFPGPAVKYRISLK